MRSEIFASTVCARQWINLRLARFEMDARLQAFLKWDVFVAQQQAAQPTVVKTLLLFVVSFLGLREFSAVLFLWPGFAASARANHDLYVGIFFGAQLVISAVFAAWMGWRFRAALFQPRPATSWRGYIVVLLIAAPVLVHEGYPAIRHSASIITLVTMKPEYMEGLMRDMWTAVTGGYTIWHVAFAAAITFVSPVLEEIVFTGLTLNRLSRRVPLAVAMLICAGLFAGVHFSFNHEIYRREYSKIVLHVDYGAVNSAGFRETELFDRVPCDGGRADLHSKMGSRISVFFRSEFMVLTFAVGGVRKI